MPHPNSPVPPARPVAGHSSCASVPLTRTGTLWTLPVSPSWPTPLTGNGPSLLPSFPPKAKKPLRGAHILPEVEEGGSDPAQGLRHPPLLHSLGGAPRWGDGQSIECGAQQRLPGQPVHLHWEADPRRTGSNRRRCCWGLLGTGSPGSPIRLRTRPPSQDMGHGEALCPRVRRRGWGEGNSRSRTVSTGG